MFGPFVCRSDVHKRSTIKIWGVVIVDKNSGATHCDIVMDYSAKELLKTLRRFGSLRGWPCEITSDPGSQLVSSAGKLSSWWDDLKTQLGNFAADTRFEWRISPANSPWRQGRAESHIKTLKRLISIAVGPVKLSPVELQTVLMESANLINERPLGIVKTPTADGMFPVITPNSLIMGRSTNSAPDDGNLASNLSKSERYQLIAQVTRDFWSRWAVQVTPEHVIRRKWHETGRDLRIGDVVLIHDKSEIKGKYLMGLVDSVCIGKDQRVRSCIVSYMLPRSKDSAGQYSGGKRVVISRSVQRLSLLLPVEEQMEKIEVNGENVQKVKV